MKTENENENAYNHNTNKKHWESSINLQCISLGTVNDDGNEIEIQQ